MFYISQDTSGIIWLDIVPLRYSALSDNPGLFQFPVGGVCDRLLNQIGAWPVQSSASRQRPQPSGDQVRLSRAVGGWTLFVRGRRDWNTRPAPAPLPAPAALRRSTVARFKTFSAASCRHRLPHLGPSWHPCSLQRFARIEDTIH